MLEDLREAEQRGTARALAQHPQIDIQACIGCGSCVAACPEEGVLALIDGVARVIHGARCIGHGRCATACPVAALQVGLGDLAKSPNLPVLSPRFETSVPGLFIAGELGGFALIRVAVEQGVKVISSIAADLRSPSTRRADKALDVLIVGLGPAGLAASLRAKELGLRAVAIDQDGVGGTVRKYPRRKLTLIGGPLALPLHGTLGKDEYLKEELIELWESLIRQHKLSVRTGVRLLGASHDPEKGVFIAETSVGKVQTRRVLLAIGRRGTPKRLGVPGEDAEKVLYQLVDAATYQGLHLLVVGGGDSAVEAATALASQPGNIVTLSYRRNGFFRLKPRNEERILRFEKDGKLRVALSSSVERVEPASVVLKVEQEGIYRSATLQNDYVFICAGGDPPYPFLRGLGIRFNGDPEPVAQSAAPVSAEAST